MQTTEHAGRCRRYPPTRATTAKRPAYRLSAITLRTFQPLIGRTSHSYLNRTPIALLEGAWCNDHRLPLRARLNQRGVRADGVADVTRGYRRCGRWTRGTERNRSQAEAARHDRGTGDGDGDASADDLHNRTLQALPRA